MNLLQDIGRLGRSKTVSCSKSCPIYCEICSLNGSSSLPNHMTTRHKPQHFQNDQQRDDGALLEHSQPESLCLHTVSDRGLTAPTGHRHRTWVAFSLTHLSGTLLPLVKGFKNLDPVIPLLRRNLRVPLLRLYM